MARLVGQKKAREIWFLCRFYSAHEAQDMGVRAKKFCKRGKGLKGAGGKGMWEGGSSNWGRWRLFTAQLSQNCFPAVDPKFNFPLFSFFPQLVNTVVPLASLEGETLKWCRRIMENSPTAIACCKAALNADEDGAAGYDEGRALFRYPYFLSMIVLLA